MKFGSFKSAKPDGLSHCVYQHLGPRALYRMTRIFMASLLLGYTP